MLDQKVNNIQDLISEKVSAITNAAHPFLPNELVEKALSVWNTSGIPTIKHEEWKFTNLTPSLKPAYILDTQAAYNVAVIQELVAEHLADIYNSSIQLSDVYTIVVNNGKIVNELTNLPKDANITVENAIDNLNNESIALIGSVAALNTNKSMIALNTILANDAVIINIGNKAVVEKPIHLINVYSAVEPTFYNTRNLIIGGKLSQVEIIETYINTNEAAIFINALTEIKLYNQAVIKHYDVQKTNAAYHQVQYTEVSQDLHSNYANYVFNLPGGDFFRNNLSVYIDAPNTECHMYGLYLTKAKQIVDNHTEIHHKLPHCESNQLYKGVMLDESKAVFNGKIFVYEDAQKTNAFQQSNNILLSDKASINAKPQLEIFADDVKCSHGTTIGQLDQNAIFYLKSRGIGEDTAKKMMVNAFAYDVAEKVENEVLRSYLEHHITLEIN